MTHHPLPRAEGADDLISRIEAVHARTDALEGEDQIRIPVSLFRDMARALPVSLPPDAGDLAMLQAELRGDNSSSWRLCQRADQAITALRALPAAEALTVPPDAEMACPVCGGEPALHFSYRFRGSMSMVCKTCGSTTHECSSRDEAINAWRNQPARTGRAAQAAEPVAELDIEATAENIARNCSAITTSEGPTGRYHQPTYNAAKAGADMALRLVAHPAPASEAPAEGPQISGWTCAGCRHFHSEYWREPDGEGGMDSGTSAKCLAADKHITSYYGSRPVPPNWCPHPLAARQPANPGVK